MSKAKKLAVKKNANAKTIKKLKKNKKYYVQVRTFTKKSGTKFYSKWSAKKPSEQNKKVVIVCN